MFSGIKICMCNFVLLGSYSKWIIFLYVFTSVLFLQVLIHYLGDEKFAKDFPHGNQRKHLERNYCKQCPSMIATLQDEISDSNPSKLKPLPFKPYQSFCSMGVKMVYKCLYPVTHIDLNH